MSMVYRPRLRPPRELELLDRDRLAVLRPPCDRAPPIFPPFRDDAWLTLCPRPEPLFFPPPVSLFTVAHARRSASFFGVPRFSYPFSMCSACRFCLSV